MRNFNYHRPSDVKSAASTLKSASEPKVLAGGMTLLPVLKQRLAAPTDLVDLSAIPGIKGIRVEGKEVVIGAMTPHAVVAASEELKKTIPALAYLASRIGDPAVRHRGTIGGSISNADPAADYPAGVVGLDAVVETSERKIAAEDFFTGFYSTALEQGEIVTAVRFKIPERAAYQKLRQPASGFAVVGVMIAKYPSGVRVAVTGAGSSVFRATAFEEALSKDLSVKAIEGISMPADDMLEDMHFSAAYRANAVGVLAKRAVANMLG